MRDTRELRVNWISHKIKGDVIYKFANMKEGEIGPKLHETG